METNTPADAPAQSQPTALEIRGLATGLLDEPLLLNARGAGTEAVLWRARLRDDDGRVWRASAPRAEELPAMWEPAKPTTGPLPSLQSLRPLSIEVRVEATDGRAATRTLTRSLVGGGVRIRRWRDAELSATLCLPAGAPCATILIDATAGPRHATVAALAAPLLASRGVIALAVPPPARAELSPAALIDLAGRRLAAVPAAGSDVVVLAVRDPLDPTPPATTGAVVVLPAGVGVRDEDAKAGAARATAWDALIARLGALPRTLR